MRGCGATWAAMRTGLLQLALLIVVAGQAAAEAPSGAAASRVPKPAISTAGGSCVEDTAFMRRNHMELIKHQRDLTVHEGIRTTKHSLANCVNCHADPKTGRVTGSREAFCEGCHTYAAVKLDCFECHADRAGARAVAAGTGGAPR